MAGSGFPQRKSQGSGGMTAGGAGSEVMDGPPPSPVMAQTQMPQPGAAPGPMPSFGEMAQPLTAGTPGRALTPEIVMGMLQAASTITGMLDSMASIAPDLANEFALQKDLLQRTLGKLVTNGGPASAPGSLGLNFPGGGFAGGTM